jgi:hypothetical protein
MRRAAKIDANQTAIVDALRAAGATVQSLATVGGGVPDLLVGVRGKTYLLEVKTPKGKRNPKPAPTTEDQDRWFSVWRGDRVRIVTSVEQALLAVGIDGAIGGNT